MTRVQTDAESYLLMAKDAEINSLHELESHLEWLTAACGLIHQLQRERGLTNLWLVSEGATKQAERTEQIERVDRQLAQFNRLLQSQTEIQQKGFGPRLLTSLAQMMLALSVLDRQRQDTEAGRLQPLDSTLAYNHLIQHILTLIFDLAEIAREPATARAMVALVHLIQTKELAGQERAWTAIGFARGHFVERLCQRLTLNQSQAAEIIEIFTQSASPKLLGQWKDLLETQLFGEITQLRRLRDQLCGGEHIDPAIAEAWYDKATEYIDSLALLESAAIDELVQECESQIDAAERAKVKIERHLLELTPTQPVDPLQPATDSGEQDDKGAVNQSLYQLISDQSAQIHQLQVDLSLARSALQERKRVERAKEVLKKQLKLDDDAAYRQLQKSAMETGRSLIQVADQVLEAMARQTGR